MQTLFLVLATLTLSAQAHATLCSRAFTFADGSILTASQLNTEFNTLINCTNSIDESNILPAANFDPLVINASIAGNGLGRDGANGVLSVNTDDTTIEKSSDTLRVKDAGIVTAKVADLNITQAKLAAAVVAQLVPVGSVIQFAHGTAPTGWLNCDGTAVSRVTYATLFALIGTTHGNGDGVATFNLPDYRGKFLRMTDGSAGVDPDKAARTAMAAGGNTGNNVGSIQGYEVQSHTHSYHGGSALATAAGTNFDFLNQVAPNNLSTTAYGGNETRPVNAYVNMIIKY